jgi:hypothetical protein
MKSLQSRSGTSGCVRYRDKAARGRSPPTAGHLEVRRLRPSAGRDSRPDCPRPAIFQPHVLRLILAACIICETEVPRARLTRGEGGAALIPIAGPAFHLAGQSLEHWAAFCAEPDSLVGLPQPCCPMRPRAFWGFCLSAHLLRKAGHTEGYRPLQFLSPSGPK